MDRMTFVPRQFDNGYNLLNTVLTCHACPEQYDVFFGRMQVGYIRLRWGTLRVDCPDCGGETVYERDDIYGFGCFDSDLQREYYLDRACLAIWSWLWYSEPWKDTGLHITIINDLVNDDLT